MTDYHAPGPWVARAPTAHKDQLRQHYWEIRKPNRCLATVYGDPNNPEIKANAHLIAAAPDLLKAVEQVLIASEDGGDMEDIDWALLRNAYNNATGEHT